MKRGSKSESSRKGRVPEAGGLMQVFVHGLTTIGNEDVLHNYGVRCILRAMTLKDMFVNYPSRAQTRAWATFT